MIPGNGVGGTCLRSAPAWTPTLSACGFTATGGRGGYAERVAVPPRR